MNRESFGNVKVKFMSNKERVPNWVLKQIEISQTSNYRSSVYQPAFRQQVQISDTALTEIRRY